MNIHTQNILKTLQKNCRINKFSKVAGYKISILKSTVFLYANNELSEREIKKTTPYTIASKRIKYLRINLVEEMKDFTLKTIRH